MLVAWLAAPALQAAALWADDAHETCRAHVCQCPRHAAPRPAADEPACHRAAKTTATCEMTGRCNHDGPSAPLAGRTDWLPTPTEGLRLVLVSAPAPDRSGDRPDAGHARIDPRPPRASS
jgi:hypothetical protein